MVEDNFKLLVKLEELTKSNFEYKEQLKKLSKENKALKSQLESCSCQNSHPHSLPQKTTSKTDFKNEDTSSALLTPKEKIKLFQNTFKGRNDVYAYRWVNREGRSGYSPAVEGGYFSAKRTTNPNYLPLTSSVVEGHLNGKKVVGIYPLLSDETCWFIAADFDKDNFQDDALAYLKTCRALNIPAYIEQSRSCNGAHVWIFFDEPIPASIARKLGFLILTKTMNKRHQIKLSSYDRFFPNQDTLPKGGFGNLIALPLQKNVRAKGGSIFVNDSFQPYQNQWQFLSSIERVSFLKVQKLVEKARQEGRIVGVALSHSDMDMDDPWTLPPSRKRIKELKGPFPESVRVIQSNQLFIEKEGLPSPLITRLKRIAAFQNPEFFRHQAMRLSVYNKPRVISCSEDFGKFLALPRGCYEQMKLLFESCNIKINVENECFEGEKLDLTFQGTLRELQDKAVSEMLKNDIGILSASTAFGKTVVAANMIAKRKRNTLVLVHRKQLMDQWRERLSTFLDIPIKSIGVIGGGKKKPTGNLDIAMLQSLVKKGVVNDVVAEYGHVIVDECHHISAFSFESILKEVKAKYVLGLTATPKRKDGHHPIVVMQCGSIRFRISDKEQAKVRNFDHVVYERKTSFVMPPNDESYKINEIYAALVEDETRNKFILNDLVSVIEDGRTPLLLTERTAHLEYFQEKLSSLPYKTIMLRGGMGKKQTNAALQEIKESENEKQVIIATGRYIGEGFDHNRLDTLFLAMPISWTGTLQQYVGRLHRRNDQKKVVKVYDYVDHDVSALKRMYRRRLKGYNSIGYRLIDPEQELLFNY